METLQVNIYTTSFTGIFKRARLHGYFKNPLSHFVFFPQLVSKIYNCKKLKNYCTILLNQIKKCFFNKVYFTFSGN